MNNEKELTHIDLFSGIGGFTLAAEWAGFRTVVFCEKEKFCQKVLKKHWPRIPIIEEIRDFDGTKYRGATLLTGGFPCQPFSYAGKQKGKEDDRYLWPEMLRIIGEAKPHWILAENVPGIFRMALDTVLADLERKGYTTGTFIIPACGLNAPHRRNRVWIIANSIRSGTRNQDRKINDQEGKISQDRRKGIRQKNRTIGTSRIITTNKDACDTSSNRYQGRCEEARREKQGSKQGGMRESEGTNSLATNSKGRRCEWRGQEQMGEGRKVADGIKRTNSYVANPSGSRGAQGEESRKIDRCYRGEEIFSPKEWQEDWYEIATHFCRVDDGVSDRVHRLKALGNAIVPQIAYEILKNIAWIEKQNNS